MKSQHGMSFRRRDSYLREQQRQSKHAPRIRTKGPYVRNSEELTRVAIFPDHTHEDGSLRVEGISRDDLTHRGFSIFRNNFTSRATVQDFVAAQIERNPERRLDYVLTFLAGDIRAANDQQGYQAFIIIDDASTKDLVGHALILCAEKQTKSRIKELRRDLVKLINNPYSFDEIYP